MKRRPLPLLSLLVWLSFACSLRAEPVNVTSLQQPVLGMPSGRYIFVQLYGEEANVPEPLDRENQYRDELRNKTLMEMKPG